MKNTIHKKLFLVRKEVGNITKNQKNPFYNNNYSDLNEIVETLNPILEKHNLLLVQPLNDNKVISTIIDVETQEQVQSSLQLPIDLSPQKIGSAITYYRRYTLQSLLALLSEDDDGNKAENKSEIDKKTLQLLHDKIVENPKEKKNLIARALQKFMIRKDIIDQLNNL